MPQRDRRMFSKVALALLAAGLGNAKAEPPCIDARPTGYLIESVRLTYHSKDGREVPTWNLIPREYNSATATLSIYDGERVRALKLTEWPSLDIAIGEISPIAQRQQPLKTRILTLNSAEYRLDSMQVSKGIISFGNCVTTTDPSDGDVRFNGTLTFSPTENVLRLNGTFDRYTAPPQPATVDNPGSHK